MRVTTACEDGISINERDKQKPNVRRNNAQSTLHTVNDPKKSSLIYTFCYNPRHYTAWLCSVFSSISSPPSASQVCYKYYAYRGRLLTVTVSDRMVVVNAMLIRGYVQVYAQVCVGLQLW